MNKLDVRIETLPPMRVASAYGYGPQPEGVAGEKMMAFLKANNVGSRTVYPPISRQPVYLAAGSFPVSERYCARGLWLPSSSFLTDETIRHVCAFIRAFFQTGHGAGA